MATNAALNALQAEAEAAHGTVEAQHRWPFGPHGESWDAEHADAAQAPDPRWCAWQAGPELPHGSAWGRSESHTSV